MVEEYTYSDYGPLGKFIGIVLGLIIVAIVGYLMLAPASEHASRKHPESSDIRRCMENKGPDQIWKFTSERRDNHYIFGCEMPDGKWGLQIAQLKKDGTWMERTAFTVKDGTWGQFIEYVTARAIQIFGG